MNECRSTRINVVRMLDLLAISGSSLCRKMSLAHLKRERKPSQTTDLLFVNDILRILDIHIRVVIEKIFGWEFVCYSYRNATKYYHKTRDNISRKVVLRIMKENGILNHTSYYFSPTMSVVESIISLKALNTVRAMNIKYFCIHVENCISYFCAIIDFFIREVIGKYFGYHCTFYVKKLLGFAFLGPGIEMELLVTKTSDNATRFVLRKKEQFMSPSNLDHIRMYPYNPNGNTHIESFNTLLEKEEVRRFEFSSSERAGNAISIFIEFHKNERLRSAIDYVARRRYINNGKKV